MTKRARDRDRALATQDGDVDMDDDADQEDGAGGLTGQDALGSKVVVIHLGSQNLRIGLGSDALPKTVPMVIARKSDTNEWEESAGEPSPKRIKLDDGSFPEPEKMFGDEVSLPSALRVSCLPSQVRSPIRFNVH
jgi:actin-related protein 8